MAKIVVTGGSGKAGKAVVLDLLAQGHEVINVDRAPAPHSFHPFAGEVPFMLADLTNYGEALEAISAAHRLPGIEAVVHFAAIPSDTHATPQHTFEVNTISTYNVFSAAMALGIKRVVWASSETTLGLPFEHPPDYVPVDESHPLRPESSYALSKVVGERMATHFNRLSGIPIIGLRLSNVMARPDYDEFPSYWGDPMLRKWNLWGYVDESHVAESVRLALEVDIAGAENFIIAARDTVMRTPSAELMATVFPGVPVDPATPEFGTLLDIRRARSVLGYRAEFSWRQLFDD